MKKRLYYENEFAEYPDVVTIPEFCKMLGGISNKTARKLLHENRVKYFCIRTTFLIPKTCVIDYVLSPHYAEYSKTLRARI